MHFPRRFSGLIGGLLLAFSVAAAAAPQRVTVGAYLNDIHGLDIKTHTYAVDLYLWFLWKDPKIDPSASFEFINPSELWGHVRSPAYEKPRRLPSGEFYQVVRHQGRFTNKLKLDSYPFDEQILAVEFEDASRDSDSLLFSIDPKGLAVNPKLELPGFLVGTPSLTIKPYPYPTEFGDTGSVGRNTYSRVRLELSIFRPVATYAIKLLVPVLCVIVCAALMFLFSPMHVDARVGIGITALLTIVALQITLNDDLPEVAYLVLMDKIYIGGYLFVIAGLGVVVATTRMFESGEHARAAKLNRVGLVCLTVIYLAATAGMIILNL